MLQDGRKERPLSKYNQEDRATALWVVEASISNCQMAQPKFPEGSAQHSLLKNRIKALSVSKTLLSEGSGNHSFTKEELTEALAPVSSIISKCEKAKQKFQEGSGHHTRLQNMIKAMEISKALILAELEKKD